MNTEELESKLRELEPRKASEGFAGRVLAQRGNGTHGTNVSLWRWRVSVPVPALAALVVLFIVIQVVQWRAAGRMNDTAERPARILEIALVERPVERPFDLTRTRQPFLTNPVMETSLNK